MHVIMERFRTILHEGEIDKRVQYMIEGLFAVRKNNFADYPQKVEELDLVEDDDQIPHDNITLQGKHDLQRMLDMFKYDPDFEENEKQYDEIRKEILGDDDDDDEDEDDDEDDDDDDDDDDDQDEKEVKQELDANGNIKIVDMTEGDLINLRRKIYLAIMSALTFEEMVHKLLKFCHHPGLEGELCNMLIECCSQERTYIKTYGEVGQRFCMLQDVFIEKFDESFAHQYSTIHRYETGKLRNIAKFFAHILHNDAFDWNVMKYVFLNEIDTTSSSRIFIKILFQELSELMGLQKLKSRCEDPLYTEAFENVFPTDNPKNTRFAINFFTSIGLGGLTEGLREHLKNLPKRIMLQQQQIESDSDSDSSDSDDSDSDDSSSSDSDSSDDDSSDGSDSEDSDGSSSDDDSNSDSSSSDSSSDSDSD